MNDAPSPVAAWALVAASGAFEILFSVQMKESDGFRSAMPAVVGIVGEQWQSAEMTAPSSLRSRPPGGAQSARGGPALD